ncbi:fungal-specific transcription factor domain-containing protein [Penicillium angulare]|uniref:Fungal-specific transcription factor domain-containing protein n=1 Tax=Penicillium angulare TaxID=116970 RepID=A0A9W9FVW2_9EURO|nr:fungal-specific transcription factor domain-containing protein [Penicillium angulare]
MHGWNLDPDRTGLKIGHQKARSNAPLRALHTLETSDQVESTRRELANKINQKTTDGPISLDLIRKVLLVFEHPYECYTDDENDEREHLQHILRTKLRERNERYLSGSDFCSLGLILRAPEAHMTNPADREELLVQLCVLILENHFELQSEGMFGLSEFRFLKRALRNCVSSGHPTPLLAEVESAIEKIQAIPLGQESQPQGRQWLRRDLLEDCLTFLRRDSPSPDNEPISEPIQQMDESESSISKPIQQMDESASSFLSPAPSDPPMNFGFSGNFDRSPAPIDPGDPVQICHQLAFRLLNEGYISRDHACLPILDLSILESHFEAWRKPKNEGSMSSGQHAVLNFCWALGSLSRGPIPVPAAETFYQRGYKFQLKLASENIDSQSSNNRLILIQCDVLRAQYLWAAGCLEDAWTTISTPINALHTKIRGSHQQICQTLLKANVILDFFFAYGIAPASLEALSLLTLAKSPLFHVLPIRPGYLSLSGIMSPRH